MFSCECNELMEEIRMSNQIVRLPTLRATRRKCTGMKRLNQKQFLRGVTKRIALNVKEDKPEKSRAKKKARQAILEELRVCSPLTLADLVEQTNHARSTIRNNVNELEREGYVTVERQIGRNGNVVSIAARGLVDPGQGDLFGGER
jgi:DNA-binding MarR family transcriptional regulator